MSGQCTCPKGGASSSCSVHGDRPLSTEQRIPVSGEYVHVAYTGGFSRTGTVNTVDRERHRAYIEFHYSIIPSEWIEWNRLSYNKTALEKTP